jgi:hypothetical protein
VQRQCALDGSDHLEIAADPVALADMLIALDPSVQPLAAAEQRPRRCCVMVMRDSLLPSPASSGHQ